MGRELRKVIPSWEHPKFERYDYIKQCDTESYQPMFDTSYIEAISEWIENHQLWSNGNHPDQEKYPLDTKEHIYYADWNGDAPEIKYYRPFSDSDATWFQVYETVSEGTPISPPFETKEELVEWMSKNKDFWGYQWTEEQANNFVMGTGWAMSGVIKNGEIKKGYEVI